MISTSEKPAHANVIPILNANEQELERISREGMLSLTLDEMRTIQSHFATLQREPTTLELETIAQTWSEHCFHKTFRGKYEYREEKLDGETALAKDGPRSYANLLKDTIANATEQLAHPWCLSVFKDNAGVIAFDETDAVAFKVETHNHPSALEPYGGAGTGLGGVIRDILGCGLGGKPVMNTDVFCFGHLDTPASALPEGVLPPKRIAKGVVSGVRDYGNRMGIPTGNGAIYFDPGYTGNPLVFCGTIGLMPNDCIDKSVKPGDLVVAVGGRTGRDGVHGATFSSAPLTKGITSSVVQIGHAIMEKKMMDVLLQARAKKLYRSVTDCGAGGFSSSVGELGSETGVRVDLAKAPLKYPGLQPWEIWVSESQERMVLAVPPENWKSLETLFAQENVEAVVLGEFTDDKKLTVLYNNEMVGQLDMGFLHGGNPKVTFSAVWNSDIHAQKYRSSSSLRGKPVSSNGADPSGSRDDIPGTLRALLAHPVIASKETVIRQYDHEVQGGSIVKPLMGVTHDAPTDACVFRPKLDSWRGVAVANGLNPEIGKWDPYVMAKVAVDEAYRNLLAVGGGLKHAAILDNFCWGDNKNDHDLAALVRAAEGAKEAAIAYGLPFISGKDSFHNTWRDGDGSLHSIPPTLLVSSIAVLEDVRTCVTSSLKSPDNLIYLIGETKIGFKGSLAARLWNASEGNLPDINLSESKALYKKLQSAFKQKQILSCHDLSEGGLAVALAEMAFGSLFGAEVEVDKDLDTATFLFSEAPGRFLIEVAPDQKDFFEQTMGLLLVKCIGKVTRKANLTVLSNGAPVLNEPVAALKKIWKESLHAL